MQIARLRRQHEDDENHKKKIFLAVKRDVLKLKKQEMESFFKLKRDKSLAITQLVKYIKTLRTFKAGYRGFMNFR